METTCRCGCGCTCKAYGENEYCRQCSNGCCGEEENLVPICFGCGWREAPRSWALCQTCFEAAKASPKVMAEFKAKFPF